MNKLLEKVRDYVLLLNLSTETGARKTEEFNKSGNKENWLIEEIKKNLWNCSFNKEQIKALELNFSNEILEARNSISTYTANW